LDDLAAALRDGVIGGAGLDVFGQGVEGKPDLEPLPPDHALYNQHPSHLPRSSSVRYLSSKPSLALLSIRTKLFTLH
jgi:lactate dehydrogenase-like 2-hydroxyacid dehydrogenase